MKNFIKLTFLLSTFFIGSTTVMADDNHMVTTRFGIVDGSDYKITFKGKPISPQIDASLVKKLTQTNNADYLLLTQVGGTGCEGNYFLAKVTSKKVTPFHSIASCDSLVEEKITPGKSIKLIFADINDYKNLKKRKTYIYDIPSGILKQNGKVISTDCPNGQCE